MVHRKGSGPGRRRGDCAARGTTGEVPIGDDRGVVKLGRAALASESVTRGPMVCHHAWTRGSLSGSVLSVPSMLRPETTEIVA